MSDEAIYEERARNKSVRAMLQEIRQLERDVAEARQAVKKCNEYVRKLWEDWQKAESERGDWRDRAQEQHEQLSRMQGYVLAAGAWKHVARKAMVLCKRLDEKIEYWQRLAEGYDAENDRQQAEIMDLRDERNNYKQVAFLSTKERDEAVAIAADLERKLARALKRIEHLEYHYGR